MAEAVRRCRPPRSLSTLPRPAHPSPTFEATWLRVDLDTGASDGTTSRTASWLRQREQWADDLVRHQHATTTAGISLALSPRHHPCPDSTPPSDRLPAGSGSTAVGRSSSQGSTGLPATPPLEEELTIRWTTVVPPGPHFSELELSLGQPGRDAKPHALVLRGKPCLYPHARRATPRHLSAGLTSCFLTRFATTCPQHLITPENVDATIESLAVERINGHQVVRGRGRQLALSLRNTSAAFPPSAMEDE